MILYKNKKVKVHSLDGDTDFFDIVASVMQGDTLTPYLFIICLDFILQTLIDLMKENGFTLAKARSRRYPTQMIMDMNNANDIALLVNTPTQTEFLLHSLELATGGIGLHMNAYKKEFMCFNQRDYISILNGRSQKLVDKFTYLESSVSSTENDINTRLVKAWTAIDRLLFIGKSDISDKIKHSFFQAAVVSILLYGCTIRTLTKCMERKLDGNCKRILSAILNKSWRQHPIKQQLYCHLPPISKTIQISQTSHVGHCWRSKDELISNVLLLTPSHRGVRLGEPARTYLQHLWMLHVAMDDW